MTARTANDLLAQVLAPDPPPFALLHRPERHGADVLDLLVGVVTTHAALADIPLHEATPGGGPAHEVLVVIPYRQIAERGFDVIDDGAPLLAMRVTGHDTIRAADVLARVPDLVMTLTGAGFDADDEAYADTVRRIVNDEIGAGEGSNFVIKRSFVADIGDWSSRRALAFFCRLLAAERGAYWTFVIHTGQSTFVGATPERHITVDDGNVVMNPISGTYRYPTAGPTLRGITEFLADAKETAELYMVLDEELKMMARICAGGGRVTGPYLREMAQLAHTEYFIEGRTERDVREVLRETMFAPTVTGSPVESASRVIRRYEPAGRGYYGGVAALIGRDAHGARSLDSAILIRTAEITAAGRMRIPVGATLVRHSHPSSEAQETRAKAAVLLNALGVARRTQFNDHPEVCVALRSRNAGIAAFWLSEPRRISSSELAGLRALVIDAEDNFTAMLGEQLGSLGLGVELRRITDEPCPEGFDLVVMGPGPGDPRDLADPRIARLHKTITALLAARRPFLAVCLSHQVLSLRLGLDLRRRAVPNQGVQRDIELFGRRERVGFYNSFVACSGEDIHEVEGVGRVEVSRDPNTLEVHALRGARFASMQFHAESVLTVDGPRILARAARGALGR